MLGKCIKNEFVNRSAFAGMLSAGVMLFACLVLGLDKLYNWSEVRHLQCL